MRLSSLLFVGTTLAHALAMRHEEAYPISQQAVLDIADQPHLADVERRIPTSFDREQEKDRRLHFLRSSSNVDEPLNDERSHSKLVTGPEDTLGVGDAGYPTKNAAAATIRTGEAFVPHASDHACGSVWSGWAESQDAAVEAGTVLVFDVYSSVGNLFVTLGRLLPIVRRLELGLIFNWKSFEGFRVAFEPAEINWDVDSVELRRRSNQILRGDGPPGRHAFKFADGFMILSDWQVDRLGSELGVAGDSTATHKAFAITQVAPRKLRNFINLVAVGAPRAATKDGGALTMPNACAWNMLLKRSQSMMVSMNAHRPWANHAAITSSFSSSSLPRYAAWHIRTSEGETAKSFSPTRHTYIFDGQRSSDVFPAFFLALGKAEDACRSSPVGEAYFDSPPFLYISSNSKSMAHNCSIDARSRDIEAGFVDLGLSAKDSHTRFSTNPNTAVNAFIDFLFLMDSDFIVRTASSFSGTVAMIRGLDCQASGGLNSVDSGITICVPPVCLRDQRRK
ncbi:unnamed protein product [Scytosiphon promiscuus]